MALLDGAKWVLTTSYNVSLTDDGQILYGKYNSMVLQETEEKKLLVASHILEKICLVHNCDNGCIFVNEDHPVVEERETVRTERCVFVRDRTNKFYLLNRYYLGESWRHFQDSE